MQKKSILFILPFLPYPMESGGHQALFNGIYAVKDDFDVYITYEALDNDSYRKAVKDFADEIPNAKLLPLLHKPSLSPKPMPLWYRRLSKVKSFIKKMMGIKESYIVQKHNEEVFPPCSWWLKTISPLSREWVDNVSKICDDYQFDIIQVEMPWFISQVLSLPSKSKKVFVHHEIGFVRRELETSRIQQSAYVKACKCFADYNEIYQLNMYDMVITLSPIDTKKLIDNGVKVPVHSSFAVVRSLCQVQKNTVNGKRLVFVGSDKHNPNYIGITWFLDKCWQKLKQTDNGYMLYVIGKWSEQNKNDIKSKCRDVEFLGFVDDLHAAIKGSVMIVPITVGSGIRMKILEAASQGVPFVTTSVGAEGIPVKNGIHCFITDNQDGFVDSIVKLQDKELQKKFVYKANEMIRENYSLEALRQNRIKIYNQLLINK